MRSTPSLKYESVGLIERRWGMSINAPTLKDAKDAENLDDNELEECEDGDESKRTIPDIEDSVDANGKLLNQLPAYDKDPTF
jgi:hypothetical protein